MVVRRKMTKEKQMDDDFLVKRAAQLVKEERNGRRGKQGIRKERERGKGVKGGEIKKEEGGTGWKES